MSRELDRSSPSSLRDTVYKLWRKFTSYFSEQPQQTGHFWTNGKPIYRKVIDMGVLADSSANSVAHGLTGVDEFVELRGAATGLLGDAIPLPNSSIDLQISSTHVTVVTDFVSYQQAHVIIDYTLA